MSKSKSTEREKHAVDDEPKANNVAENSAPKQGDGDGAQDVQQQAETVKPSVSIKKKRREGTRKPLKPSVIRRLCEPHSQRGCSQASAAAEIMYTNPQFSIDSNIHSRSSINVSHNPPKLSTLRLQTKSRRSPASKAKRRIKTKPRPKTHHQSRRFASRLAQVRDTSSHQWLCTEMNGEIYKVMDLPRGLEDLSCILLGRPGCSKKTRKRGVGKRTHRR